jgi:HD-GYP domain-containing protein (c-di-GMP phosphodiesterase class II)
VETLTDLVLPKGITVRTKGESIETVSSQVGQARLLSASQGVEVVEITLAKDGRMFLEPPTNAAHHAVETYYIISGALRLSSDVGSLQLGAGDSIVLSELQDCAVLIALTDVRMIYVTTQPFFHEMSDFTQKLMALAVEVELKDGYTSDHCNRLQSLSYATGQELALSSSDLYRLNYGAYLHDLGKVRIPLEILQKPAKLTSEEWDVMKKHPTFGREMLGPTLLKDIGPLVEQHHERFDGSGYPYGLSNDEVLIGAYIVAVADTYDAMTTDRVYRKALSPEVSFAELEKYAGTHYPREVVKAFFSAVKRIEIPVL